MTVKKILLTYVMLVLMALSWAQSPTPENSFAKQALPIESKDRYLTDSTFYYLGNTFGESWFKQQVYRVQQRNEASNVLMASDYEYDTLALNWFEQRRYEGSFLNDTIRRLWLSYVYQKSSGQWLLSDSIHFNIEGSPTISWYKIYDPLAGKFTAGKLSEFIYINQNSPHLIYNKSYDTISEKWKNEDYEVIYYNRHELDSLRQFFTWNAQTANWDDSLKIIYTYDVKLYPDEEIKQLWNGSVWENYRRLEFIFDGELLDEVYEYQWFEILGEWMNKEFSNYEYYPDLNLEIITDYLWDGSDWLNKTRRSYTYNADGLIKENLFEFWSFGNEAWTNASLNSYIYDYFGNRREYAFYTWDEDLSKWNNFYKEENFWSFYPSGIFSGQHYSVLKVFPNPGDGRIRFEADQDMALSKEKLLLVFSMDGRLVFSEKLKDFGQVVNLSALPAGTYQLILKTEATTAGQRLLISR